MLDISFNIPSTIKRIPYGTLNQFVNALVLFPKNDRDIVCMESDYPECGLWPLPIGKGNGI
jgi:hypothetical protein